MRTKVLGANQRIKIGTEYTIGNDAKTLARVLRSVGLVLEVEVEKDRFVLYAARRPLTHDIADANAKPAPAKNASSGSGSE